MTTYLINFGARSDLILEILFENLCYFIVIVFELDVMYLKMYIKSERFYQQPDNQALKEERCFSDYEEELDDRKLFLINTFCNS